MAEEAIRPGFHSLNPQVIVPDLGAAIDFYEDVDAVAEAAVAAGAEIVIPVADQFYGDRAGRLKDPFGHLWAIATHQESVSDEEVQRRFQEMMEGAG